MSSLPRISVITPSYNQGRFIGETIESVLNQNYPNLEYIIMDGGSNDETVDTIKKYESKITHWQSEKDNGQASAINEGFKRATGDILCWLNSDDIYELGTFDKIVKAFSDIKSKEIVFGNTLHFDDSTGKKRGSDVAAAHELLILSLCDYMIQPSSFWTRATWEAVGSLEQSLNYTFDWDWFIRASKSGTIFLPQQDYFSKYRIHDQHKSGTGGNRRAEELKLIAAKYNDPRCAAAFAKWIDLYNKRNFISKIIDFAQNRNFTPVSAAARSFYFSELSMKEYRSIVRMN